jgi:hypothetical protein
LINGRPLAPRTARYRNLLAARDRDLQFDQLAPAIRGATCLPSQVDEREAPPRRVARLTGYPGAQVRGMPSVPASGCTADTGVVVGRAHAWDCATPAWVVTSVDVGGA